jgi:hypothetical protein
MTTKKGRTVGTNKLDAAALRTLRERLRTDIGPVNLTAVAKEVGISRTTLLRYIKDAPGLQEALNKRRQEAGRGYELKKRRPKVARSVLPVEGSSKARDPLPQGGAAGVHAMLWRGLAEEYRHSVELGLPQQDHLRYALAHVEVFEALAAGGLDPASAQGVLDSLTQPGPLHRPTPEGIKAKAQMEAQREAAAQEFKAREGYRPSSRKLSELMGWPSAGSLDPEAFAFAELRRKGSRDVAKAAGNLPGSSPRRKSYPSRPRDAQGRPLVPRGHMAKLLREQEAKGLQGQAAKDAAEAAALAEVEALRLAKVGL